MNADGANKKNKFRVPIWTVARRVWSGEWQWFQGLQDGRKRLGLVTTGGRRWWFAQDRAGCWLKSVDNENTHG